MMPDHYATLGLTPTSEQVVIRAAYLALMRRYHPDGNPSAAAAERTRAINEAYAVLSDPERRADYDTMRGEEAAGRAPRPFKPPPTGLFAAAAVVLLLSLVPLALRSPMATQAPSDPVRGAATQTPARAQPKAPTPTPARGAAPAPLPSPPPSAEAISPPPPRLQPNRALPLALSPLPAPASRVAVPAPPRLAKAAQALPGPAAQSGPAATKAPAKSPKPAAAAVASQQKPSFNCSVAKTRGELAVCANSNLATLDRQQALIYSQSWARADAAKRAKLLSSRDQFIARREACSSSSCTSAAYLARMREVSEIMSTKTEPAKD